MRRIVFVLYCCVGYCFTAPAQDLTKDTSLGRQVYEFVEGNMGFYHHPEIEAYVSKLGQKLVSHLGDPLFPFSFYLVDSPEPNAFASPGGRVFLTRGLLALPITEDELACVMAHEIIHSQNRHYISRKRSLILGGLIALPGLLIESIFQGPAGQVVASPFTGAGALINAQYSQGDELEADRQGVGLAATAGYNPSSLATILKRMEQEREFLTGEEEKKSYLSTHPYTPKRVKQIREEAVKKAPNKVPPLLTASAFLQQFDGLPMGPNPGYGFVKGNTLFCPQFPLQVDSLPGWSYAFSPSSVGLVADKDDALLIMEAGRDSTMAATYLSRVETQIRKMTLKTPNTRNDILWEGHAGGMIEYEADIRGKTVHVQIFAIDYTGKLLTMLAACYLEKKKELDQVLATVKPLRIADMPDAEQQLLKASAATGGETATAFATRMGASAEIKTICLINDRSPGEILKEGEIIKWILRIPFRFRQ